MYHENLQAANILTFALRNNLEDFLTYRWDFSDSCWTILFFFRNIFVSVLGNENIKKAILLVAGVSDSCVSQPSSDE